MFRAENSPGCLRLLSQAAYAEERQLAVPKFKIA